MSFESIMFNIGASRGDAKRDQIIPLPSGVVQLCDISYGPHGKWNLLDVYYPEGSEANPVIVNVHGGGYVYGTKEIYKRYCMDLARRGFTVVSFNYRLAPKWKFPTPLEDINSVLLWLKREHASCHVDISKVFMVGDSAGAQLASQYTAMLTNRDYMALFGLPHPGLRLRAVGLNCGLYDMNAQASGKRKGLALDYFGRKISNDDPRLAVLDAITSAYPPAHITTACHDFLRANAQPMYDHLRGKNIPCQLTCYGSEEDQSIAHVFHVNILKPEAIRCNDDQCAFFRQYL